MFIKKYICPILKIFNLKLIFLFCLFLLALTRGEALAAPQGINLLGLTEKNGKFIATEQFSSPLPLVIIDYTAASSAGNGRQNAALTIINNHGAPVSASKFFYAPVIITAYQAPSIGFSIEISGNNGERKARPVLGMPKSHIWSLRASKSDTAMLRNYLGFKLASIIYEQNSPEAYLCEVLYQHGDELSYQGIFLLSEYIEQGVFLAPRTKSTQLLIALPKQDSGYQLIDAGNAPPGADGYLEQLNIIDQELASKKYRAYFAGLDQINANSFYNTAILYNLMANHKQPGPDYYLYKQPDGRIGASIVWNFDTSLDNDIYPLESGFHYENHLPWFPELLMDMGFIKSFSSRFFYLDRKKINYQQISKKMDEATMPIQHALKRDWAVRNDIYKRNLAPFITNDGERRLRQSIGVEQEILKIKYQFEKNKQELKKHVSQLEVKNKYFSLELRSRDNVKWAFIFIGSFFFIIWYIRKKI